MISLNEMAGLLQSGTVNINGATVKIRAVTASEQAEVLAAVPRPTPPLTKDPAKGSAAPKIENEKDPAHIAAMEKWYAEFRAACVAIACSMMLGEGEKGAKIPAGPVGGVERKGWIQTAAAEVAGRLPLGMIERLYRAQVRVGNGQPAEEETGTDPTTAG